ncbi:CLUMA_CG010357, isoform A [Clunio marinus]|uniref:CLUMA_CG010357, isoform A n=1 Tax=Clunio marinus TaxID=568069 RepID=A0A1J1I9S3_9DIPT|nr:CLUMA_CG010357, isoform A [Clunio marinus]
MAISMFGYTTPTTRLCILQNIHSISPKQCHDINMSIKDLLDSFSFSLVFIPAFKRYQGISLSFISFAIPFLPVLHKQHNDDDFACFVLEVIFKVYIFTVMEKRSQVCLLFELFFLWLNEMTFFLLCLCCFNVRSLAIHVKGPKILILVLDVKSAAGKGKLKKGFQIFKSHTLFPSYILPHSSFLSFFFFHFDFPHRNKQLKRFFAQQQSSVKLL